MLEHGAYRLLLDRYYSTEEGIPATQAYRLARARSDEERQAVDAVLEEFFELVEGVWINGRAEEEIAKAKVRIDAAKANGKRGGRPKKKPDVSENETQKKPGGFFAGSENETQQKAHQAPSTKHQAPEGLPSGSGTPTVVAHADDHAAAPPDPEDQSLPAADPIHRRACEIVALLRHRGARLTASNPAVRGWAERPITDAQLLTAFEIAEERRAQKADPSPINAGFLDAILRDVTDPQASARASPARPSRTEQLNARNQAAIAQAKAAILAREVPSANE